MDKNNHREKRHLQAEDIIRIMKNAPPPTPVDTEFQRRERRFNLETRGRTLTAEIERYLYCGISAIRYETVKQRIDELSEIVKELAGK